MIAVRLDGMRLYPIRRFVGKPADSPHRRFGPGRTGCEVAGRSQYSAGHAELLSRRPRDEGKGGRSWSLSRATPNLERLPASGKKTPGAYVKGAPGAFCFQDSV